MIVLSDCDGVLLDFDEPFYTWRAKKYPNDTRIELPCDDNIIMDFVKVLEKEHLTPIQPSIDAVKEMHDAYGAEFIIISAIEPFAATARAANLGNFYGSAIKNIICLGGKTCKSEVLKEYENSGYLWIEDNVKNAHIGQDLGLDSVIIEYNHNKSYTGELPYFRNMHEIKDYWIAKNSLQVKESVL